MLYFKSMIYCTCIWRFGKSYLFLQKSLLCQTMELMDIMKRNYVRIVNERISRSVRESE